MFSPLSLHWRPLAAQTIPMSKAGCALSHARSASRAAAETAAAAAAPPLEMQDQTTPLSPTANAAAQAHVHLMLARATSVKIVHSSHDTTRVERSSLT